MKIISKVQNGPVLIEPTIHRDDRGYFYESFNEKEFKNLVADVDFVQDNQSCSEYGVLRGLHFQKPPFTQAKLVRVIKGAVMDVVVDLRKGSPTYGQFFHAYLSEENHRQFYVPRGFAHGFVTLKNNTVFQYKCDNYYNKESEGGIHWDSILPTYEPSSIPWSELISYDDIKYSAKDDNNPSFYEFESQNPFTFED